MKGGVSMPYYKIKTKAHPRLRQFRIYGYLRVSTIDQDTERIRLIYYPLPIQRDSWGRLNS